MFTRKRFLVFCTMLVSIFLVFNLFFMVFASGDFNWRQCEGEKIRVMLLKTGKTDVVQERLSEFTDLTGIEVKIEVYPEDVMRQKRFVEMTGKSKTLDVFDLNTIANGYKYAAAGWFEPLDEYVSNPEITNPDYDFEDFFKGGIQLSTINGVLIGLPTTMETVILYYRKDLLEKYKVSVPTNLVALELAIKKLTLDTNNDGKTDIYGITMRGKRAALVSTFGSFLYSLGGKWFNEEGKPDYQTPEFKKAIDMYARLLRNYGPPSALGDHWKECTAIFANGMAAFFIEWNPQWGAAAKMMLDSGNEEFIKNMGCAIFPAGKAGSISGEVGWGVSINPFSQHKKASWLFLQWMTSKDLELAMQLRGYPTARKSAWESNAYKEQDKYPQWSAVCIQSAENALREAALPLIIPVSEVREVIGEVIQAAILDEDWESMLEEAEKKSWEIMEPYQ